MYEHGVIILETIIRTIVNFERESVNRSITHTPIIVPLTNLHLHGSYFDCRFIPLKHAANRAIK